MNDSLTNREKSDFHESDSGLPYVVVFVPVYNHEEFIGACLESIISQDYPKLRIIVGDDASQDTSPEIIKSYCDKYPHIVTALFHKKNLGVAGNVNSLLAVEYPDHSIVNFFAGDDLMLPGRINAVVNHMMDNPHLGGCYQNCEVFDSSTGRNLYIYSQRCPMMDGGVQEFILGKMRFALMTFFTWKYFLPTNEGHDINLQAYGDFDYILRIINNMDLNHKRVGYLKEPYVRYRRHQNNISASRSLHNYWYEIQPLLKIAQMRSDLEKICDLAISERSLTNLVFSFFYRNTYKGLDRSILIKNYLKRPGALFKTLSNMYYFLKSQYLTRYNQ